MKILTEIYRSASQEGMYLYVQKKEGLSKVPELLMVRFGKAELAMTLLLSPSRTLANADVNRVMETVCSQGFYLQMPPVSSNGELDSPENEKLTSKPI